MNALRNLSESLARTTSRRGFFGRGAEVATGLLIGAAAGTLARPHLASAHQPYCGFPGPACPCEGCHSNGVCAKPCIIMTVYYASGCWISAVDGVTTCCDCDCNNKFGDGIDVCGCSSNYHNPSLDVHCSENADG